METRRFGPLQASVPVIGQGTWYNEGDDLTSAVEALRLGVELGMSHIDTAEMYLDGESESLVGKAIDGIRNQVFLVSKVLPQNASYKGTIAACESSLIRLRTDRLDSYLLHWRSSYPLEETISAFEQLVADGKILSWGVSNFDAADLNQVIAIAGEGRMSSDQVLYHLKERAIEHRVLPWCEEHGMAVVAYSPFGHGDFPKRGTTQFGVLEGIGQLHGATPRQVALRFLIRRPLTFAIPKASSPEHVAENAGAGDLQLTPDELKMIDEAFPLGPAPRVLPVL